MRVEGHDPGVVRGGRLIVAQALAQGARLNFGFRILKEEKILILEGETFHVCTGLNEKPRRIPDALSQLLRPWLDSTQ